jgi:MAF protein
VHRLILASASPRRKALLAFAGWAFTIQPARADETEHPGEAPVAYVQRLSREKAQIAAQKLDPGPIVIGADTTVVLDDHIIGKPADAAEAARLLRWLRGRAHEVLTGVTVFDTVSGQFQTDFARSRVPMRAYTEAEIAAYVATGDPLDKAGAYAIQHGDFKPVEEAQFADCFANVMGLPVCLLNDLLARVGLTPPAPLPPECRPHAPGRCPLVEQFLRLEKLG